jgi:hypothetical protein
MSRAGRPAQGGLPESARFVATALRYFGPSSYGTIRYVVGYLMEVEGRSRNLKLADMKTKRGIDALRKRRYLSKRPNGLYEMHTPTTAVLEIVINGHQRFQEMVARLGPRDSRVTTAWEVLKQLTNRVHFAIPGLLSGSVTPEGLPVEPSGLFFEESNSTSETDPVKVEAWRKRGMSYFILGIVGGGHRGQPTPRAKAAFVRQVVANRRLQAKLMGSPMNSSAFAVPSLENPLIATKQPAADASPEPRSIHAGPEGPPDRPRETRRTPSPRQVASVPRKRRRPAAPGKPPLGRRSAS